MSTLAERFEQARSEHPGLWDSAMEESAASGFEPYSEQEMSYVVRMVSDYADAGEEDR